MRAVPALAVVLIALGLCLSGSGCSLTFKFGKPPEAPMLPTALRTCVWKHTIKIRPASASTQSESNPHGRVNRARQSRAWTFYRGGVRLSAQDALARLRDTKLSRDYRRIWVATARRGRIRVLGSSTALAAAVLLGLAGGGMVHDFSAAGYASMTTASQARIVTGFAFIGVAAVASVILPLVMKVGYRDVRAGEAFTTLFISTEHESALNKALARYNQRVRKACRDRHRVGYDIVPSRTGRMITP